MTNCGSRPRLRQARIFRVLLQPEPVQVSPLPRPQPASAARETQARPAPSAKSTRSSRALARLLLPRQLRSQPRLEEPVLDPPQPPQPLANQSRRASRIPWGAEVNCSRSAQAMVPLTALEANWWWVPHEPLTHEELPPRAKPSPLALPVPWGAEMDCSRPAQVMLPPTALQANWWWVPHEPLMHEELPRQAKPLPLALPIPSEWEVGCL
jgi:hypothetical protein